MQFYDSSPRPSPQEYVYFEGESYEHKGIMRRVGLERICNRNYQDVYRIIDHNRGYISRYDPGWVAEIQRPADVITRFSPPKNTEMFPFIILNEAVMPVGVITIMLDSQRSGNSFVGYFMNEWHTMKGYASHALGMIVDYVSTQLRLTQIQAHIMEQNLASQRTATKNGFINTHETHVSMRQVQSIIFQRKI